MNIIEQGIHFMAYWIPFPTVKKKKIEKIMKRNFEFGHKCLRATNMEVGRLRFKHGLSKQGFKTFSSADHF